MYFEAKLKNKTYSIEVLETHKLWRVGLKPEGGNWEVHEIPKSEFRIIDSAISFIFENSSYMVDVVGSGIDYTVYTRGSYRSIHIYNDELLLHESLKSGGAFGNDDCLRAGMPGKIAKIFVKPGDNIVGNNPILIMEAMKMENEMRASVDVIIKDVLVTEGDSVESGAILVTFQ
jgi:acetyl/propionyl-CoA carboxylase alpha subunit